PASTRVSRRATRAFAASPRSPDIRFRPAPKRALPIVDGPSVGESCDCSDTNRPLARLILSMYSLRTEWRDQMGMGWIDGAASWVSVWQARVHARVRFLDAHSRSWRRRRRPVVRVGSGVPGEWGDRRRHDRVSGYLHQR